MFAGGQRNGLRFGKQRAEDVFDVAGDARRIALAPLGEDLEGVGDVPVLQPVACAGDAGLLAHLAPRRVGKSFLSLAAAGDRLPEAWMPWSMNE